MLSNHVPSLQPAGMGSGLKLIAFATAIAVAAWGFSAVLPASRRPGFKEDTTVNFLPAQYHAIPLTVPLDIIRKNGANIIRSIEQNLRYSIDCDSIKQQAAQPGDAAAAPVCMTFSADDGTHKYLERIVPKAKGRMDVTVQRILRFFMNDIPADAIQHIFRRSSPELFLLSGSQWEQLLGSEKEPRRAIDIGTGTGDIAGVTKSLFSRGIVAVEPSPVLTWRLWLAGFETVTTADPTVPAIGETGFDAVFALNLLDRVDDPWQMLRRLRDLAAPSGGKVVISLPLPYEFDGHRPFDTQLKPLIGLTSWEAAAQAFMSEVLPAVGLQAVAFTRAPYLCQGSQFRSRNPVFVLDVGLFVAIRTP